MRALTETNTTVIVVRRTTLTNTSRSWTPPTRATWQATPPHTSTWAARRVTVRHVLSIRPSVPFTEALILTTTHLTNRFHPDLRAQLRHAHLRPSRRDGCLDLGPAHAGVSPVSAHPLLEQPQRRFRAGSSPLLQPQTRREPTTTIPIEGH